MEKKNLLISYADRVKNDRTGPDTKLRQILVYSKKKLKTLFAEDIGNASKIYNEFYAYLEKSFTQLENFEEFTNELKDFMRNLLTEQSKNELQRLFNKRKFEQATEVYNKWKPILKKSFGVEASNELKKYATKQIDGMLNQAGEYLKQVPWGEEVKHEDGTTTQVDGSDEADALIMNAIDFAGKRHVNKWGKRWLIDNKDLPEIEKIRSSLNDTLGQYNKYNAEQQPRVEILDRVPDKLRAIIESRYNSFDANAVHKITDQLGSDRTSEYIRRISDALIEYHKQLRKEATNDQEREEQSARIDRIKGKKNALLKFVKTLSSPKSTSNNMQDIVKVFAETVDIILNGIEPLTGNMLDQTYVVDNFNRVKALIPPSTETTSYNDFVDSMIRILGREGVIDMYNNPVYSSKPEMEDRNKRVKAAVKLSKRVKKLFNVVQDTAPEVNKILIPTKKAANKDKSSKKSTGSTNRDKHDKRIDKLVQTIKLQDKKDRNKTISDEIKTVEEARELLPSALKRARTRTEGDDELYNLVLAELVDKDDTLDSAIQTLGEWTSHIKHSVRTLVNGDPKYVGTWLIANRHLGHDKEVDEFKTQLKELLGKKKLALPGKDGALPPEDVTNQLNNIKMTLEEMVTKVVGTIDESQYQTMLNKFKRVMMKGTRLTETQKKMAHMIQRYIHSISQLRWYNENSEPFPIKRINSTNANKVQNSPAASTKVRKQASAKASNPSANKRPSATERFKLFKAVYDTLSKARQDVAAAPVRSAARSRNPGRSADRAAAPARSEARSRSPGRSPSRSARSQSAAQGQPEIVRPVGPGPTSFANEPTNALKLAHRSRHMGVSKQLKEQFPYGF